MTRKVAESLPTEDQEQTWTAVWLAKNGVKFYAVPNGGTRNLLEAIKLKRTGVQPGVPDICIPIPAGKYHGLYIEMKRQKGGKLSNNQVEWLSFLRGNGYFAEVAYGFEDAKKIVSQYLSLTKLPIA